MDTKDYKRKLGEILHADVEGCGRLMGGGEDAALEGLTADPGLINS